MSNLASTYEDLDRPEEAELLRVEVLEKRKSTFGEEHEDTIDAIARLGTLYLDLGKLEGAKELIQRVWITWLSAGTMAQLYKALGEFLKTELSNATIQVIEKALGPKHPYASKARAACNRNLACKHKLAAIYWGKVLAKETEKLEVEPSRDSVRILGLHHPLTLKCRYSMAVVLKRHGREAEAIQLLVETTNEAEQVIGSFNEDISIFIGTLSEWCGADKAIRMLLNAQEVGKTSLLSEDWEVISNLFE
ncbi:hypothetical protein ETB97_002285 [Aspergillus alliaceus]|uniref:Uncharacterized protein n=1 Tax=Petromyces alliaceus TaxID=209559 RepID=A0A8H6EAQ2_PETAA|nr:hypothetical protein ETB97_002285 [Aspergillus burnettii]